MLRGRLDEIPDLTVLLEDSKGYGERIRKCLAYNCEQTKYWYDLWFSMSNGFVKAQHMMTEEIDRLRKKCDEWDGNPYLDKRLMDEAHKVALETPCRDGHEPPKKFKEITQEVGRGPFAEIEEAAQ